jgi:hypothetical protein
MSIRRKGIGSLIRLNTKRTAKTKRIGKSQILSTYRLLLRTVNTQVNNLQSDSSVEGIISTDDRIMNVKSYRQSTAVLKHMRDSFKQNKSLTDKKEILEAYQSSISYLNLLNAHTAYDKELLEAGWVKNHDNKHLVDNVANYVGFELPKDAEQETFSKPRKPATID